MTIAPPTPVEVPPEAPAGPHRADEPTEPGRSMRIGWVVALTMLGGLILAVVLDVVVFDGAREHVITGVALLSFSFGWGVLAAASARLTDQPQRWAGVPCTAMGLTGAAVLVLAHSNGAMENLGWVWPPLSVRGERAAG